MTTLYIIIALSLAVVCMVGGLISYFSEDVSMATSRVWAKFFFLSLVWPLAFVLFIGVAFIWAFGPTSARNRVFG
jgi:hypothetical protein